MLHAKHAHPVPSPPNWSAIFGRDFVLPSDTTGPPEVALATQAEISVQPAIQDKTAMPNHAARSPPQCFAQDVGAMSSTTVHCKMELTQGQTAQLQARGPTTGSRFGDRAMSADIRVHQEQLANHTATKLSPAAQGSRPQTAIHASTPRPPSTARALSAARSSHGHSTACNTACTTASLMCEDRDLLSTSLRNVRSQLRIYSPDFAHESESHGTGASCMVRSQYSRMGQQRSGFSPRAISSRPSSARAHGVALLPPPQEPSERSEVLLKISQASITPAHRLCQPSRVL